MPRSISSGRAVLVLDQENACVLEVVEGKADAFIYDQMSTYQNWLHHEDTTIALLKPFQEENWAIGVRKGKYSPARAGEPIPEGLPRAERL